MRPYKLQTRELFALTKDDQYMRNTFTTLALAVATVGFVIGAAGDANALSKKIRNACGFDYQDFCSQYDPNSSAVRRCFESNRKSLSKGCIRALVDAGEVPAKYLKR